jgi:NAD(P) transhydrogenase subunit beta
MLSHPESARKGNMVAAVGMFIAIFGTIFLYQENGVGLHNYEWIFGALVLGTVIGTLAAKRVKMTAMPELVSLFNGMGGACAALISVIEFGHIAALYSGEHPDQAAPTQGTLLTIFLGLIIGAVSW